LYFDVIDLDFTSLYPSIIKSLNLGIETLVGRIKVPHMATYEQNHSLDKLKERDPNEEVVVEKVELVTEHHPHNGRVYQVYKLTLTDENILYKNWNFFIVFINESSFS
jgi:DNA polymerase elongation subunit (family B)